MHVCLCFLPVVWLTQFAKELHSQRSIDEEEQHEEETEISHLEAKRMLDPPLHTKHWSVNMFKAAGNRRHYACRTLSEYNIIKKDLFYA